MTDKEFDYMVLQRENENLLKANKDLVREIEKIQSDFTDKVAESEIKANDEAFTHWQNECENKITIEKRKAVKEFAEKLKDKFNGLGILFYDKAEDCHYYRSLGKEIDELLKEYEKLNIQKSIYSKCNRCRSRQKYK